MALNLYYDIQVQFRAKTHLMPNLKRRIFYEYYIFVKYQLIKKLPLSKKNKTEEIPITYLSDDILPTGYVKLFIS